MFSVITDIYNKKTKGPTLVEMFRVTGKLKKVLFLGGEGQLGMFDMCITDDTAQIDTIFNFLQHTRQYVCFLLAQTASFSKFFTPCKNGIVCRAGPLRTVHEMHVSQ